MYAVFESHVSTGTSDGDIGPYTVWENALPELVDMIFGHVKQYCQQFD